MVCINKPKHKQQAEIAIKELTAEMHYYTFHTWSISTIKIVWIFFLYIHQKAKNGLFFST